MPWLWNRAGSDGGIASGVRGATSGREAIAEDTAAFVQSRTVARASRSRHRRILPAVISLRHNDGARFAIAGVALVILAIAVGFSKRRVAAMSDERAVGALADGDGVHDGDSPTKLAIDALDRWIYDLGDEEHDLRAQLRKAKSELQAKAPAS